MINNFYLGPSIYSSVYYQETGLPVPILQLRPNFSNRALAIGSSSNPIDFLMHEIKEINFFVAEKQIDNQIVFYLLTLLYIVILFNSIE